MLRGGRDDGVHVGVHDHVTRQYHEETARSDESSRDNNDVDSNICLDVNGSDMTP